MSNQCNQCGSYAINHHHHGRDGSDPDLCDVCYWHTRHDQLQAELAEVKAELSLALKVPSIAAMHTWLDSECAKQNKQLEAELAALKAKAAVPEYIVFPTMLRKMWSGGEVQKWLDEHHSAPAHPQSDAVIVPRELANRLVSTDNHVRQTARRELRNSLLGGEA